MRNKTRSWSYKIKECERFTAVNTDKVNELRQQDVYSYDDLQKIDESFDFSIKAEKEDIYKSCAAKLAYDSIGNHACAVCDCDKQTIEFGFHAIDDILIQVSYLSKVNSISILIRITFKINTNIYCILRWFSVCYYVYNHHQALRFIPISLLITMQVISIKVRAAQNIISQFHYTYINGLWST